MPIPPPAPPVARYDMVTNYRCGESIDELERADDGEWVRYEDVEAHLTAQAQAIAQGQALISRVVTGDGAQLENLDITDGEWECIAEDAGQDREHFEITLTLDDWLAMVHIAREADAARVARAPHP